MKLVATALIVLTTGMINYTNDIPSQVFSLSKTKIHKKDFGEVNTITQGKTRDFQNMEISLITLNDGGQFEKQTENEKLIIVQSGTIFANVNTEEYQLGSGSVIVAGKEDKISIKNTENQRAKFYLFLYQSSSQIPENSFQPIVKDWQQIEFKPHDKGGIRNFFNEETDECIRFEMHVTNLNAGIKSHEPHTHRAGEFVLVTKGNTEMEIDGKIFKGSEGDLYFLESEVSHAIKNIGTEQCQYFAFQTE